MRSARRRLFSRLCRPKADNRSWFEKWLRPGMRLVKSRFTLSIRNILVRLVETILL